jgi:glycosyltransferase involved in cell wall biosynthesis
MKKTILYINPGPAWHVHSEAYQRQYLELSKSFKGYILVTSGKDETFSVGEFSIVSMKFNNGIINIVKFVMFCIWNALKLKMEKVKIDLVSTYDPLKTGMIGMVVSKILGAKFAPEVRGVYTSSAEWVDNEKSLETQLKKRLYPMIMYVVLRSADGIKLLFKEQVDYFGKLLNGKVIQHFPSYVAIDNFKNLREEKEILFVGYPFKRKGVDILIASFKKISSKYPEWKLKIIGWYPDPSEIDHAIDNHPQISRLKPVPHAEIPGHIGSCAMLVLPSRSEAMGRVLVEAMAAGKPRIGARVDGIPTVIEDGIDGLLFESENIDDLANKMDSLMSNQELRTRLGKNGENRAKKDFTMENYVNNLINFYLDVLGT